MLLNHLGDHFAELNQTKLAAMYFRKATEADGRAQLVRQAVMSHEHLSQGSLLQQAENENAD
jgi:two-component system chemotaxis response regulator CheB